MSPFVWALLAWQATASAAPSVLLSVDRAGAVTTAHLTVRGSDDVELSIYALPEDPALLLGPTRAPPAAHLPRPLAALDRARQALVGSTAQLHAGLSVQARALLRGWLDLGEPLARAVPAAPSAQVESLGHLLRAWRVDTSEEGWSYLDIDLGPLEPGLYSLVAHAAGSRVQVVLPVGALSLLCVRAGSTLTVLAEDGATGMAKAGVEIFADRQGQAGLVGRTGADGTLQLRAPLPALLVGRLGGVLAKVGVPAVAHLTTPETVGAVLLDRLSVQPGEAVGVFALFRGLGGGSRSGAVSAREGVVWRTLPDTARAEVDLRDREGRLLGRQPSTVSALGIVNASVEVPLGLSAGLYTVGVAVGEERRGADLWVREPGPSPLSVQCQGAGSVARCTVHDGAQHPLPGAAVRWRLERQLEGPTDVLATGADVSDAAGQVQVALPAGVRGFLRAAVTDGLGRTAGTSLRLAAEGLKLAFHPERRLLRPGHSLMLSLDEAGEGVGALPRVHVIATAVRAVAGGDSVASPLFDRWFEPDAHGRVAVPVTASSPGYIELSASSELDASGRAAPVALAHATLFVSESGGDIPATPERLTLVQEALDHRRGEELRLLVLTPFEAGTVLLSFEPPLLSTQAVSVRGYSGVMRLTLPTAASGLTVVAAALRGGRLYTDRLTLLRPQRAMTLTVRLALDRGARGPARPVLSPVLSIEALDEAGQPLSAQVTVFGAAEDRLPTLAELLEPPVPSVGIETSTLTMDSLPSVPASEPQPLTPYGPLGASSPPEPSETSGFQTLVLPETGRATLPLPAGALVMAIATAGPDEIGEARQRIGAVAPTLPRPSLPPPTRTGDRLGPLAQASPRAPEHTAARAWPAPDAQSDRLADALALGLSAPPGTGPSADLACAAVRALGAVKPGRASLRGPLARLSQQENLAGGFGEAPGELRRDLAALRGLTALGPSGDPELLARTQARLSRLLATLADDDPQRAGLLRAALPGPRPESPRSASAAELAAWLGGRRPRRDERAQAALRVRELLPTADVLDLGELAVAAASLGLSTPRSDPTNKVTRRLDLLRPAPWTHALLAGEEDLPEPMHEPVGKIVTLGSELQITLAAVVTGHGVYCVRDFPAAGTALEGAASAGALSGAVLLCGTPSGGGIELGYRVRAASAGRFQMPAPAFGVLGAAAGGGVLEISP